MALPAAAPLAHAAPHTASALPASVQVMDGATTHLPASRSPARVDAPAGPADDAGPELARARPLRDWMLVDLDCFYVAVERLHDASLVGRAVVVGGDPRGGDGRGRRGVVSCASYEARQFGVRAGMPVVEAARRLPREAVFVGGDHARYERASRQVMEVLRSFTPVVEPLSLDEAFLDMSGCQRLFGDRSWLHVAGVIRDAVKQQTGLTISIGIAGSRTTAKVACDLAKPAGLLEVHHGEEGAFLAGLPLDRLPGIGPRTLERLERFHLRTIGDLAALPPELLVATFGRFGRALAVRARGLDAEGDTPRPTTARSISRETTFAEDTDDREMVEGMLSYLAQRALRALREEGLHARTVAVRLRYADFETVQASRRLRQPTDHDDDVLGLVRTLGRRRWNRRVKLRLVGVALTDLVPVGDRQMDLFDRFDLAAVAGAGVRPRAAAPQGQGLALRLDEAIDRIRERHGFGSVIRGRAIDLLPRVGHDPNGFRLETPACSA
jgi:DNA polymerase-4